MINSKFLLTILLKHNLKDWFIFFHRKIGTYYVSYSVCKKHLCDLLSLNARKSMSTCNVIMLNCDLLMSSSCLITSNLTRDLSMSAYIYYITMLTWNLIVENESLLCCMSSYIFMFHVDIYFQSMLNYVYCM